MSNQSCITSSNYEYSCTVKRASESLDFSAFRQSPELTIGLTDVRKDTYREITLSPDEARQLREHLNDPETMTILGIRDISGVRCPTCGQVVGSFLNHPCVGSAS